MLDIYFHFKSFLSVFPFMDFSLGRYLFLQVLCPYSYIAIAVDRSLSFFTICQSNNIEKMEKDQKPKYYC